MLARSLSSPATFRIHLYTYIHPYLYIHTSCTHPADPAPRTAATHHLHCIHDEAQGRPESSRVESSTATATATDPSLTDWTTRPAAVRQK